MTARRALEKPSLAIATQLQKLGMHPKPQGHRRRINDEHEVRFASGWSTRRF